MNATSTRPKKQAIRAFCSAVKKHPKSHQSVHPTVSRFLRGGVNNRVMALKKYKTDAVTIDQFEVFSCLSVMPAVRRALLELYAMDENAVLGDVQSLQEKVSIVYVYEPLKDRFGRNARGRPRKVQVSG